MNFKIDTGSSIIEVDIDFTKASLAAIQTVDLTAVERETSRWSHESAVAEHEEAQANALDVRTSELEHEQTTELLNGLATENGFSWATIARAIGVTPTAVRKWRRGEEATAANHQSVARLAAFVSLAENAHPLANDISYWIEAPVFEKSSITRIDLYRRGAIVELFDLIAGRRSGRDVLDELIPNWRTDFLDAGTAEVVWNEDGSPTISQVED
jgi:transcriptional regulator with XRE-family HTH domain